MKRHTHDHLSAEGMQAFLDGELARSEQVAAEEHLNSCARCSLEAESWRSLFGDLAALRTHRPNQGFSDRVMVGVQAPAALPLAARLKARVQGVLTLGDGGHVTAERLQDFAEGALPSLAAARVSSHLAGCGVCTSEAGLWQGLIGHLNEVDRFEASEGFADRVMAGVMVAAPDVAPARSPAWGRAIAVAARAVPRTREAWAALSGVAVTPAAIFGLVVYVLASHPTLTPGALASFVWWQLADLATAALSSVSSLALESGQAFGLYSLYEVLAAAPVAVAAGALVYTLGCALALRVLYTHLVISRSDGRYAHVSPS